MTASSDAGNGENDTDLLRRTEQRRSRLESSAEEDVQRARTVAEDITRREADDRSWIAKWIIWVFAAVTGWELFVLGGQGWLTGKWSETANLSIDLIKSTVLPIVTLVLGYYFGRSGKG